MRSIFACLFVTLLSACGTTLAQNPLLVPVPSETALPTPTLAPPTVPPTQTPIPTPTQIPTLAPTPTETLLPPLELPALESSDPLLAVWDGQPIYLADSMPGYSFRVKYKSAIWALVTDSYGQPALGHRTIEYCVLAPAQPFGLAPGLQVEHDTREIGKLTFEINTALLQGVRQFVTYQATDKVIFTGFQVNFVENADACLADAEAVLATLTSIPTSLATPIP